MTDRSRHCVKIRAIRGQRVRGPARRAFTLLELLLGLIISTMILGVTASVFVTMMRSWDDGTRRRATLQAAQTTADLIERHLRCAVPPGGAAIFRGEDLSTLDTSGHRLLFLSTAQGRFPRSAPRTDASEVEFRFDPLAGGGLTMRIDSTPDDQPDGGGATILLSPLVRSFRVQYYDGTEWLSEWSDNKLPLAVDFHFTIAADNGTIAGAGGEDEGTTPGPTEDFGRLVWMPLGGQSAPSGGGAGGAGGGAPEGGATCGA